MTDKPTPKEMEYLFVEETGFDTDDFPAAIFVFARAVLAKWGSPVVAGDVDRADAVNLARNALTQYDCAITKKGVRVLAEAVLSMDSALTTPEPTHAQAGAVPLTDEQIKALMQAHRTAMLMTCKARAPECGEFAAIAQDLDWLCESFGIKGVQHGTE